MGQVVLGRILYKRDVKRDVPYREGLFAKGSVQMRSRHLASFKPLFIGVLIETSPSLNVQRIKLYQGPAKVWIRQLYPNIPQKGKWNNAVIGLRLDANQICVQSDAQLMLQ
eukprot:TRINITY_DN1062_c0_g3_i1.p3 TRINITY_DN1062_c0_g3~~TRINITY_DN1062_c0_g3_i1.p3  ORF type:complete len:111 (-),score=1.29 TRINITY_DN1062_c0_g3_i1:394-726(-)